MHNPHPTKCPFCTAPLLHSCLFSSHHPHPRPGIGFMRSKWPLTQEINPKMLRE